MDDDQDTRKSLPGKRDESDNSDGDQRHKARITEEQKQKSDSEREFKKKYDEKTKKKTTKKRPGTQKKDTEEPKPDEEEIGSHRKTKGKKKFFSFLKDLARRSTWKKIVFNLRNLFRTKASFEEEINKGKNVKLLKLMSVFGFKSKAEEKILEMRVAYLLQELRQLDRSHQNFKTLTREISMVRQLIALTTSYLKSERAQGRVAAKELLASQVAQTHSTTIDKQQHTKEQSTTVEFNKQFEIGKTKESIVVPQPRNQHLAYMMRQHPLSIEAGVAFGVMGVLFSVLQSQMAKMKNFVTDKVQDLMMASLKGSGLVDFSQVANSPKPFQSAALKSSDINNIEVCEVRTLEYKMEIITSINSTPRSQIDSGINIAKIDAEQNKLTI